MYKKTREQMQIDEVTGDICGWLARQTPDYSSNQLVIRCLLSAVLCGIDMVETDILSDQDKESVLWQWYAQGGGQELVMTLFQGYMATKGR